MLCSTLILLTFFYLFATVLVHNNGRISTNDVVSGGTTDVDHFLKLVVAKYGAHIILENITLEDGSLIWIADFISFDPIEQTRGARLNAYRIIQAPQIKSTNKGLAIHSVFRLKLPTELSQSNLDTSKWKIDHGYLILHTYYHLCAEIMFYCDGVKLSRESDAAVLSLGLGGGMLHGFLRHHFPKMNITSVEISARVANVASKWFDLKLDDRHSLIITDGVKFVEEQALKGTKYDAISLDACYSKSSGRICPVKAFLNEKVIRSLSRLVKIEGIIIVNTIVEGSVEENSSPMELFSRFFRYCYSRKSKTHNDVLYCMHQRPSKEKNVDLLEFIERTPLMSRSI
ncbi:hypothetical protein Y032_0462g1898 [Ancylostoma ceylanicum]|nr:hypothetical protein Y032_0462g1898 [Ancylostoma ceylanicum]